MTETQTRLIPSTSQTPTGAMVSLVAAVVSVFAGTATLMRWQPFTGSPMAMILAIGLPGLALMIWFRESSWLFIGIGSLIVGMSVVILVAQISIMLSLWNPTLAVALLLYFSAAGLVARSSELLPRVKVKA